MERCRSRKRQKLTSGDFIENQGYDPWDPYGEYDWQLWGAYCLEEEELKQKEEEVRKNKKGAPKWIKKGAPKRMTQHKENCECCILIQNEKEERIGSGEW